MSARTPTLTREQRSRVRTILTEAIELEPKERAQYVAESSADDPGVRDEAMSLLRVADDIEADLTGTGDLLEAVRAQADLWRASAFEPGRQIGRYTIIEEIGRGGFAIVYLAEQRAPLTRRVALKVLSLGIESEVAADRFRVERQVLASLDSPGIASIYDAGMTRCGRLYFAMELVDGKSITRYCDHGRLGIRERVALVARVCDAVHHAHQRGVIHRDLKPSNILVPAGDTDPIPRVIDFGIAKVVDPGAGADETMGAHVLGTPDYMSPEQLRPTTSTPDIRADVYSLGVVLYELLTGTLPVDRGRDPLGRGVDAQAPSPSQQLRTGDHDLASIALARSTDAASLRRTLRGELSWILARALQHNRDERYTSVSAMAADLRAWLDGRPISVGPETATYRVRKFVARHRWPVAGVLAASLALGAGVIGTGTAAVIAERNARAANLARDEANAESYAARVSLLGNALNAGNRTLAIALRTQLDKQLRPWERGYFDARMSPWIWSVDPDGSAVGALAATPDGQVIALLTQSGGLYLLSVEDGSTLARRDVFEEQPHWFQSPAGLAVDSKGSRLLAGNMNGRVVELSLPSLESGREWDLGAAVERIKYSDAINAFVLLLRDGRLLSIAAGDATPNDMGTLDPGYHDMALVNDGRTAAIIAGSPRELVFVNLVEGAQSATDGLYAGSIAGVPGGSRVIASNHDRELDTVGADMVDAESGEVLRRMSFSKNVAGELALTEGGRLGVFTPTYSRLVGAIDLTRGGASHIVGAHDEEYVTCVVQAPGGLAVSGDSKGIVRLWDPERAEGSSFVRLKDAFLSDVTSDPNGKLLAICGRNDNRVLLLDLTTGSETAIWDLASSAGYVSSLAFSADAALACVMYSRGRVEVRSVPRGELVRTICEDERASTSYTLRADFSADGRWLAVPDTTGRVRTWSVPGLDLAGEFFIDDASVYQVVFSPDSETLVAAWKRTDDGAGGGVVAWDHDSLRELLRMDSNMGLTAVEFDPQRSRFVVGGFGGECWIYDLETKQRTDLVGMGKERVATIAFTPDGQRVIGTGHISKAIVWDADSGLNLLAIPGPSTGYHTNDLDIASDGTLITCGGNVVQIHPNASPRSAATWQGPEGSRP